MHINRILLPDKFTNYQRIDQAVIFFYGEIHAIKQSVYIYPTTHSLLLR